MERKSKSQIYKLNLCLGVEIVHFGYVLYGCYLDFLLYILDVWDILDVLLGCYYGYLDVYVLMLKMFGCLCVDVYDTDSVKYD